MQAKIDLLRMCGAIEAADGVNADVKDWWRAIRRKATGFDFADIFG